MLAGKYAEDDVKQKEEEEKGDDAHGDENTVKKKQCASVNIGIKKGKKLGSAAGDGWIIRNLNILPISE